VCPDRVATAMPDAASHSRAVLSKEPVRTIRPSGENATAETMTVCPDSGLRSRHGRAVSLRHAPSSACSAEISRGIMRCTTRVAAVSGSPFERQQHTGHRIVGLLGLLLRLAGDELRPIQHHAVPKGVDLPETHERPAEHQRKHRIGPALQPASARLGGLGLLDQPLALGEPLALGADARFLGRLTCRDESTLQISDVRRVVPSARNPGSGVGQLAATQ
jgi:hypothetical protein